MSAGPAELEDVILVSDLHLGSYRDPAGPHDQAFSDLLEAVTRAQAGRDRAWRLVVLGDLLDFPAAAPYVRGVEPGDRAATVMDVAEACAPLSIASLRSVLEAGGRIDLVAGNHDFELMHRDVQRVVEQRLAPGNSGRLSFFPWLYRLPGLMHAEHGSQHHDINRVGGLLARVEDLSRGSLTTPAAVLGWAKRAGGRGPLRAAAARATVPFLAAAILLAASRNDSERARAAYAPHLDAYARSVDLPADVLAELDGVSRVRAVATARRIVGRTLRRDGRHEMREVMARRAADVHDVLRARRLDTPFYVFGHTHEAHCRELPAGVSSTGGPAWYVNTGTWSPFTRGSSRTGDEPGSPSWVHIDVAARRARLCRWGTDAP